MGTSKKFVREGRMGAPFSYKTGAIVESYPKPLLCFEFDCGGLDVVKQPIERILPSKLSEYCKREQSALPPITAIEFGSLAKHQFDLAPKVYDSTNAFAFLEAINTVVMSACPWRTVVLDPLTGLTAAFIGYVGITDSAAMDDARRWAHKVGVLIERAIMVLHGLQAHTVVIMHTETEKNETTGEILTDPMVPSKLRQRLPSMFSQFFYATIEAGKPIVYAQPVGFVKSVGMRKPEMAGPKMGALFQDIYAEEYRCKNP